MYKFVDVLKLAAVFLITNCHLTDVFPTNIFSHGGQLGNLIFFLTSGFCLTRIHSNFPRWYAKRLYRIYPVVWIISLVYIFTGLFSMDGKGFFYYLIYPLFEGYHFIVSILILYVFFYLVDYFQKKVGLSTKVCLGLTFLVHLLVYLLWYDKSFYHIDRVLEPMVRFMFFESMLLGKCLYEDRDRLLNAEHRTGLALGTAAALLFYLITKVSCMKFPAMAHFQIVNQYTLIFAVYMICILAMSLENKFNQNAKLWPAVRWISGRTLEIYLVQMRLIDVFRSYPRPWNFILILITVAAAAELLHVACVLFYKAVSAVALKWKKRYNR